MGKVIIENNTRDVLDLAVYKPAVKRILKDRWGDEQEVTHQPRAEVFVVRLGDSADKGRMVTTTEGKQERLPNGRAMSSGDMAQHPFLVFSPIVELTDEEWNQLLESHNGPMLRAMEADDRLTVRHIAPARPARRRKGEPEAATR